MLHNLQTWLIGIAVISIGLTALVKAGKAYINRDFKNLLDKSMTLDQVQDPQLREKLKKLSLDVVDLMEYTVPNRGNGQLGADKFAKADATLAAIPFLADNADLRKNLIEAGCELMWNADDVMKEEVKDHQPPATAVPQDPPTPPITPAA